MRKTSNGRMTQAVSETLWRRLQEGGFILLTAWSIFLFVALFTYHEADPGWSHTSHQLSTSSSVMAIGNAAGKVGAWFADLFLTLFGYLAYMFPSMIAYGGVRLFQNRFSLSYFNRLLWGVRVFGFLLAVAAGCGLASLHFHLWAKGLPYTAGGILGQVVMQQLGPALGALGSTLVLVAVFLAGITLTTGLSWFGLMDVLGSSLVNQCIDLKKRFPTLWAQLKKRYMGWKEAWKHWKLRKPKSISPAALQKKRLEPPLLGTSTANTGSRQVLSSKQPALQGKQSAQNSGSLSHESSGNLLIVGPLSARSKNASSAKAVQNSMHASSMLPSVTLLDESQHQDASSSLSFSADKLEQLSREVESRLLEFSAEVKVVGVYPGPVITRFELELAAGLKVSKISGLSKDLARALSVTRVRVVEVIPGKSVVGLEIPNEHREMVHLREILESEQYQELGSPLSLALGKDISGQPVAVNLAKMPHLLVAGTTGSGKSVGVNVMLLSLLFKSTPEDVRLILIDPKMLELSIYDGIPHLLTPVVTDMKDAANVLRWCVAEMERRYQLMAMLGVRNLLGFNRKVQEAEASGSPLLNPLWKPGTGTEQPPLNRLPYIVVIIDEFADMMMVVGKKVEELIARIAQKARAAGIHMILATQRPSVDVITGLIKANVPTRIAYQVSSRIDSRTILDQQGAEQLLGHGDMLYLSPGAGIPTRIHGAFVSDEEVHAVVKAIKQMGEPDYETDILSGGSAAMGWGGAGSDDAMDGEQDALYDEAVQIVIESRRPSISHLQRRLKIGYNRAARLIETMEIAGVVSPMQSNGGRDVLVEQMSE